MGHPLPKLPTFIEAAKRALHAWLLICAIAAFGPVAETLSYAETLSLAKDSAKEPPMDLVDERGQFLERGALMQMGDLSLLNPAPDKIWQDRVYPIQDPETGPLSRGYPSEGGLVRFEKDHARNTFTYMAKVLGQDGRAFRLTASRFSHGMLLRAGLMRKLGFFVPSPRYYKKLVIQFKSREEIEGKCKIVPETQVQECSGGFIDRAQSAMTSDFNLRKWSTVDYSKNQVIMSEVVLEPQETAYLDLHWGFLPAANDPRASGIIANLNKGRAFRSMLAALILVDVPESVNRFSAKAGALQGGFVNLTHASTPTFKMTTYEDVRWLVRRMSRLTESDLRELIRYADIPSEIDEVVYRKIVYRLANLHELFDLPVPPLKKLPLRFDTASRVKEGKVAVEYVEGCPHRWSHGDRELPFVDSDIWRVLSVDVISSSIKKVLANAQKLVQVQTVDDLLKKRQLEVNQRVQEHIQKNPLEGLVQEKETWGGGTGGIDISAYRHITTGTYFESQAPIQLVDSVSFGATIGYFRALDGIAGYLPNFMGNVSLARDFTHVRPLDTVKEGTKESWTKLAVFDFMDGLADVILAEEKPGATHPVDKFLAGLKTGEVFMINDSVNLGAQLGVLSSLDFLLNLSPHAFATGVSLGADLSHTRVAQTMILRNETGLQISVRSPRSLVGGLTFDTNYYLNLLKLRTSTTDTWLKSDVYSITYVPGVIEKATTDIGDLTNPNKDPKIAERIRKLNDLIETRKNIRLAVGALLRSNDTEILENRFGQKKVMIDQDYKTNTSTAKVLTERFTSFNERHKLKLRLPEVKGYDIKSNDEVYEVFGYKNGKLKGRDLLASVMDLLESLIKRPGSISRLNTSNPANVPYGNAFWTVIDTEMDISKQEAYPGVGIISNVWGGWHMKREAVLDLLRDLEQRFPGQDLGSVRVIESEAFTHVKSLDFFRVSANMSITEQGLEKLRDLLLQPEAARGDPALPTDFNPFRWIWEKVMMQGPKLPSDSQFNDEFLKFMGTGDRARGVELFRKACEARPYTQQNTEAAYSGRPHEERWFGQVYECMTPWFVDLLKLRRSYPAGTPVHSAKFTEDQLIWLNDVVTTLEGNVPLSAIHHYIGLKNALFFVRFNGFRAGDEDGDLEFISNVPGDPEKDFEVSNGIFSLYAQKFGISVMEFDRSFSGVQ